MVRLPTQQVVAQPTPVDQVQKPAEPELEVVTIMQTVCPAPAVLPAKVRRRQRLSKARAGRLAAQERQQQGTPVTGSENDAYDTAEEMMTHEVSTCQRSKMETRKSQKETKPSKSQTKAETYKGQTKLDRTTVSTASYSQTQSLSKTGRVVTSGIPCFRHVHGHQVHGPDDIFAVRFCSDHAHGNW
uniref:Uncharacterized protein n=1 Tax=Romanomermis culicivorax TaxID=13658 RepID=A0A915KGR6_ROMCU